MPNKYLKRIITIYVINAFIVSKSTALLSKENINQYDLSETLYPDYELLDKSINTTSKINFTPLEFTKSVLTNKVGII